VTEYRWEGRTAAEWQAQLQVPTVHLYDVIDSTNNVALTLADEGAPSLTLVLADYQTAGRGRAGRSWIAEPGHALLFSVVLRTQGGEQHAGTAPIRIGSVVAEAIERLTGRHVLIKWPNDVVLPGHGKIAGILCEGVVRQQGHAYIVAGIGINVAASSSEFAALTDSGTPVDRGALLTEIMRGLRDLTADVVAPLSEAERLRLRERDLLFGELIENEEGITGQACGLAHDGSLLIATPQGLRAVQSATVRLAGTGAYPGSST
jgi:BirA family biotin operon repressor/biotin-[acetyl-CoA-carboxylase] ligase